LTQEKKIKRKCEQPGPNRKLEAENGGEFTGKREEKDHNLTRKKSVPRETKIRGDEERGVLEVKKTKT